jgi:hypothetical protein
VIGEVIKNSAPDLEHTDSSRLESPSGNCGPYIAHDPVPKACSESCYPKVILFKTERGVAESRRIETTTFRCSWLGEV